MVPRARAICAAMEETMPNDDILNAAVQLLEAAGDMDAQADARWMLCACMDCKPSHLRWRRPDAEQLKRFDGMVTRRAGGEPLQYVLGDQPFCGRSFITDSRALIPRPETEELCMRALDMIKWVRAPRVLDIGTGTGALAITIALERPDSQVTAVDISHDALSLARENAQALGTEVEMLEGDLYAPVMGRRFDLIISNPPYLTARDMDMLQPEVRREPALALFGGEDGLDFYRRIAEGMPCMVNRGGSCALEVGMGQAEAVRDMLKDAFDKVEIFKDINGVERMVCASGAKADISLSKNSF